MSRIVHVDNSEFFRKMVKAYLKTLGHESEGFGLAEEAIAVVKNNGADCVIAGLELADMDSTEFIDRILDTQQGVPIIVITSKEDPVLHMRLEMLGVKAVIQKTGDWKNELGNQLASI